MNKGKGTIIDSGTTDTYLNEALAPKFKKIWKQIVGKDFNNRPQNYKKSDLQKLPTITLKLDGDTRFNIAPNNYLEKDKKNSNLFSNRIYLDEATGWVANCKAKEDE